MEDSYVKISTRFTEWDWYRDSNTKVLFLHFLLKANTKDVCYKGIEIPRGSLITSYQILSNETGLSIKNIRTALNHLKMAGEVAISKYPKNTVITVKNWDDYCLGGKVNGTEVASIERKERKEAKERKERYKKVYPDGYTQKISGGSQNSQSEMDSETDIFTTIRELFNSVCGSYPRLVRLSEKRKDAIAARLRTGFTLGDFKTVFEKAEESEFLKGHNLRGWSADFDWLIDEDNMTKVLEGKYDFLKRNQQTRQIRQNSFNNFDQREYDFEQLEKDLLSTE